MADFLLEIGMDEIPARMIASAEAELGRRVLDLLTRERLLAEGATVTTFSTPRCLAVVASGVLARQADTEEQMTGPSWKVAFKDGAPTPSVGSDRPNAAARGRFGSTMLQLTSSETVFVPFCEPS